MDIRRAHGTLAAMMAPDNLERAAQLIAACRASGRTIATAESCTGGLIAATLAAVPGASAVLECGFVTYSNEAKADMLGVPPELIRQYGAVSKEVAIAMAEGALAHSRADVAVAITGIAGPDGGTPEKPVGLVHLAAARRGGVTVHEEKRFGDVGRHQIQSETVAAAFELIRQVIG
jgi:nicotinamide-nucleotide amidase